MGILEYCFSELNTQPTDTPVQRFKCSLATALTWLGARVIRYSFPVRLLHSLLHAVYPGALQTRGSAPRILAALPLRRALDKPRGGAQPQEYGHNRMTSLTRLSVSALLFLAPAAAADRSRVILRRPRNRGGANLAGWQVHRLSEAVEQDAQYLGQGDRRAFRFGQAYYQRHEASHLAVFLEPGRQVRAVRAGQAGGRELQRLRGESGGSSGGARGSARGAQPDGGQRSAGRAL